MLEFEIYLNLNRERGKNYKQILEIIKVSKNELVIF